MSIVTVVATHRDLSKPITIEVERSLLSKALYGNNEMAQRAIALRVRHAYNQAHRKNVRFITWRGLRLVEDNTQASPSGCSCECAGCDTGTYHCHKEDRGCYL